MPVIAGFLVQRVAACAAVDEACRAAVNHGDFPVLSVVGLCVARHEQRRRPHSRYRKRVGAFQPFDIIFSDFGLSNTYFDR